MKPVFLHIGLPKTATTALQNWLERYASLLRQRGIFCFDQATSAHRLALEAVVDAARKGAADVLEIAAHALEQARDGLTRALHDPEIRKIFISSEYFSIADPLIVRRMLAELGIRDITIIVTLRRQDRLIESSYSQEVLMMGRTAAIARPHYAKWYDWHLLVSSWAREFDRKIEILDYERIVAEGKSIGAEILSRVDRSATEIASEMLHAKVNVSVPAKLLEFKRLANRLGYPQLNAFIESVIAAGIDPTRFKMSPRKASKYMAFYRRSNQQVAREFLGLKGDLFDTADLHGGGAASDFTDRLSIEDLARLVVVSVQEDPVTTARDNRRIRELGAMVNDQSRQLVEADLAVRKLLGQVEERDQRLVEADGAIRTLLQQREERDQKLVEADGTIRKLLQQVEDRNRKLVEADVTIRTLLQAESDVAAPARSPIPAQPYRRAAGTPQGESGPFG
jgi:hypothetical protein